MDDILKKGIAIAGYIFTALLLGFTGLQTYDLLLTVSGSQVTALVGLVLFEGGMIYWWNVFRRTAAGALQLATAGVLFSLSLLFVVAAVSLHLGAISIDVFGPATPARIIIVAVLVNMIAKLLFPLMAPDEVESINRRAKETAAPAILTISKTKTAELPAPALDVYPVAYPNGSHPAEVMED